MDALPSTIGRYQIRQQLGQGGMGVLYLAFDPTMDRLVALKLLRVNDAQWRERFLREARLVARLQHPNIITIHDVGSSDGQPFMAMEYIAGSTLDTIIRRRMPLSRARKLEIMIALCDGLAYAHRSGVIHRDIKPSNLIVHRDSGLLKVLDFGIARTHDSSLTLVGSIMGTPNYMSPEQVRGQVVDRRSDVFAVGVVLYELVTHRQAFSGDTPFLVLQDIVHRKPEPLVTVDPTLDPRLDVIISRAIAKDPAERYPDLEVMRRDLIEALRYAEPEESAGREKTMLLLTRAAGSHRGVPGERLAVMTPPAMQAPFTLGREAFGDEAVDADGETSVLPTPPPDHTLRSDSASDDTHVVPEATAEAGAEEPANWRGLGSAGADRRLARIGLFAVAAVLVLIVMPVFLLTSWSARSSRSARTTPAPGAAAPGISPPLSATPLRQLIAPTASAVPAESIAALTPTHAGLLRGVQTRGA